MWSFERLFVKTGSGRQRFNVLGAYDPINQELVTVENTKIVDAKTVCQLLHKLRYKCGPGPISIVLDNARYQRCDLVRNRARRLGIELVFLPSYSPNLNLIERYWKYVKKVCLNSKYHADFSVFRQAIIECLRDTNIDEDVRMQLSTLLTPKFQTFKESQFLAA
jgi:transposase